MTTKTETWTRDRLEVHMMTHDGRWWVMNRNAGTIEAARALIKESRSPYIAGGLAVLVDDKGKPVDRHLYRIVRTVATCTVIEEV